MEFLGRTLPRGACLLAFLGVLIAVASGPGYRFGIWDLGFGFQAMVVGAGIGAAAAALGLLALLVSLKARDANRAQALIGLLIGGALAFYIVGVITSAADYPMIHDVTTDTEDPPAFATIVSLRADSPNSLEYVGTKAKASRDAEHEELVSDLQRRAYPDIVPLEFDAPMADVFLAALNVAESQGWEIVSSDAEAGLIEATDTTLWFGFKDDIAIRLRVTDAGGTRVDIRSVSRVGLSDVGKNADRIRNYAAGLEEAMS